MDCSLIFYSHSPYKISGLWLSLKKRRGNRNSLKPCFRPVFAPFFLCFSLTPDYPVQGRFCLLSTSYVKSLDRRYFFSPTTPPFDRIYVQKNNKSLDFCPCFWKVESAKHNACPCFFLVRIFLGMPPLQRTENRLISPPDYLHPTLKEPHFRKSQVFLRKKAQIYVKQSPRNRH